VNYKYVIYGVSALAIFAAGRYSNRLSPVTSNKQTDTIKSDKNQDTETHTNTTVTTVKKPDGTITTVKKIDQIVSDKTKTDSTDSKISQNASTPQRASIMNVSVLGSPGFESGIKMNYGVSVTKEVFGPLTVGGFGMTNGVIGVSIGLDF
jgi:hypothetical protein